MNLLNWWQTVSPFGRLSVVSYSPKKETIVFHRQPGKRFRLSNHPNKVFTVLSIEVRPVLNGLDRFISDSAIAGAGAAAMLGQDIMEGAIVGDWLEKQNQPTSHHQLFLTLGELTSQIKLNLTFSLSIQDCRTVYKYFKT